MKFLTLLLVAACALQVCYSKPTNAVQDAGIKPGDYPFHGILRLQSGEHYPICEVVLIERNWLLTTAGCVHKYASDPKSLQVLMGATSTENSDSEKTTQTRTVTAIEISPKWESSKEASGDIALLKVSTPFKSNTFVKIADYGAEVVTGEIYEQISYGYGDELKSEEIKAPSLEDCESNFYTSFNSTDRFCVQNNEYGGYNWGDMFAGAPIAYVDKDEPIYLVYGITTSQNAGIATRILNHKEWIESLTRPGQPERAIPMRKPTTTTTTTTEVSSSATDPETGTTDSGTGTTDSGTGTTDSGTRTTDSGTGPTVDPTTDITTSPPSSTTTK